MAAKTQRAHTHNQYNYTENIQKHEIRDKTPNDQSDACAFGELVPSIRSLRRGKAVIVPSIS